MEDVFRFAHHGEAFFGEVVFLGGFIDFSPDFGGMGGDEAVEFSEVVVEVWGSEVAGIDHFDFCVFE